MTTRTRAVRATFNSMLTAVEMLIGIGFVLKFFSSDGTIRQLVDQAGNTLAEIGEGPFLSSSGSSAAGPMKFLMTVLAFMIFGFFMIILFPAIVRKKEKELDMEDYQ